MWPRHIIRLFFLLIKDANKTRNKSHIIIDSPQKSCREKEKRIPTEKCRHRLRMNISTSECSSGCSESGWTMYLDQLSQYSTDPYSRSLVKNCQGNGLLVLVNADEGEEDLSMVSDASSGPPHLHDNNLGDTPYDKRKRKQKCTEAEVEYQPRGVKKQQNFCLDDTATSPILHFSQDNAAPRENNNSQGVSIANNQISFFNSSGKGKSANYPRGGDS